MKILKIENGKGYFLDFEKEWQEVDKIDKNGLIYLLNLFLEENNIDMDVIEEENLSNQAHLIIYKSVFEKLSTLNDNKNKFKDESDRLYLDAIQKYSEK